MQTASAKATDVCSRRRLSAWKVAQAARRERSRAVERSPSRKENVSWVAESTALEKTASGKLYGSAFFSQLSFYWPEAKKSG